MKRKLKPHIFKLKTGWQLRGIFMDAGGLSFPIACELAWEDWARWHHH